MRKMVFALIASMLAWPALAGDSPPVAFPTSVRMVLGADGKPRMLEADARLPGLLQEYLVRQIEGWRFESTDGQPIPGEVATWVHLGVCLLPNPQDPDALNMAVHFNRLGPKLEVGVFPRYPADAARVGHPADLRVDYLVQPDGQISVERIEFQNDGQRYRREFESAVREWLAKLRYVPEQVEGQAIATRMRMPIQFRVGNETRAKRTERTLTRDECVAAAGESPDKESVVLEPRIRKVPDRT